MALVKPVIFQVAGYQNSGKTTITSKLIVSLKNSGLQTVTIKHHGHGGKPAVLMQKDSAKHITSGALASIVEGDGRLILQIDNCEYSLEKQIQLLKFFHPDVILIEGYKQKNYPKLLLVRNQEDLQLISDVNNVRAVVYWQEELKEFIKDKGNFPSFYIHDERLINWTTDYIQKHVHKTDKKS
jgi:molybdopterin-guanine dinucleotide biosynthesis protein B